MACLYLPSVTVTMTNVQTIDLVVHGHVTDDIMAW